MTQELGATLCLISSEIGRQIGLLINRRGKVTSVIVGDQNEIMITSITRARGGTGRLRGLRLIHTHLKNEPLSKDDLTDLAMLKLDMIMAIGIKSAGEPQGVYTAHINPDISGDDPWIVAGPIPFHSYQLDFHSFIESLEKELSGQDARKEETGVLRAVLAHISNLPKKDVGERLDELSELAYTERIETVDRAIYKGSPNPQNLLGSGRVKELVIKSLSQNVDMILFDQELTPSQSKYIGKLTEMPILDRTELILRIFARRAHSSEAKLKVELARLKYLLPRLGAKDDALSRIRGGIGMRGPGETTMELSRRRIKDRIRRMEEKIEKMSVGRSQRRARRNKSGVGRVAVIGYTNAGKSTLLNTLTKAEALVEDKLFATLDPMSRRVRYPRALEVILSDTVGFIRDLPEDLLGAFRSTLEELRDCDMLLHLVDISAPDFEHAMNTVNNILTQLEMTDIPVRIVFNKVDKVNKDVLHNLCAMHNAIGVSALKKEGLGKLLDEIARDFESLGKTVEPDKKFYSR